MTSTIKNVAVAGATGNLGPAILDQLLKGGFKVTVLTRQGSTHKFPDNVDVKVVDYDSLDSLTDALERQDAVVSTLAGAALTTQLPLIQAAIKAGVERFIPSEFGSDTSNTKAAQLPVFKDKVVVQDVLKKEAAAGHLTYTIINNGPFFDWGLAVGWLANAKEKTISLHDGGNRTFSATTLPAVGQAVVSVLKHPKETKNKVVRIQSVALTLKKLSEIAQRATGTPWQEQVVSVDDQISEAFAELQKENPDPNVFIINFINASIFGDGYGSHFKTNDNEFLGIKELSEADIESLIKAHAQ
ncbi:hypothetical protein BKA67DRAFT_539638 [Truncatella angustata]|uniref:NmrA-like domain-containing protein n=1 Tax=Truncatella angustata TaxID=152316 RepID=A0A9P8UCR5_9PEZI|nr:uncharacterized protein BKA67DRAFT_539638 [Truncatella angustata]KAH6647794.1 hypothetical protein BKA67DRAFT_539638 [Truncatella angustata]KAH8202022.1 hypothetical protein TruAng_003777 [Truncatella angustata]